MRKKSYAKVNIFLKIVGFRDAYHLIASRFMLVKNLYDIITFQKTDHHQSFILEGSFSCSTKDNTIYKIFQEISHIKKVEDFFKNHKVIVQKNIPEFAGLGGGSSNAATFLNLIDEVLDLKLSIKEKLKIAQKVGSDIPFFIYEYESANVTGVGEIVKRFDESTLPIQTFTPLIKCSTKDIYTKYREDFKRFDIDFANKLLSMDSKEILQKYSAIELNDLLNPCLKLYPSLKDYIKDRFFSGSGSSLFWIDKDQKGE